MRNRNIRITLKNKSLSIWVVIFGRTQTNTKTNIFTTQPKAYNSILTSWNIIRIYSSLLWNKWIISYNNHTILNRIRNRRIGQNKAKNNITSIRTDYIYLWTCKMKISFLYCPIIRNNCINLDTWNVLRRRCMNLHIIAVFNP